jgi:hypothetical protein
MKHKIEDVEFVICPYCEESKKFKMLHWQHLKTFHNKTLDELLQEFPNIPTMTKKELDRRKNARIKCNDKIINTCNKKYGGVGYASKELKIKVKDSIKKKYNVDNIMKLDSFKDRFIGDKNPMRDPLIAKKASESKKGKPSKLKGKTYEEILGHKRAEERKKELRISGAIGCSMTPIISAPQLKLYEMVKEKYPTAVLEYPKYGFCLDIAIPELKLCFEYDGSYWHDKEKDKKRDEIMAGFGWKTIRYEDHLPTDIIY